MSKEINLFEVASRQKYRFATPRGEITVEQLWELPLTGANSIDALAVTLYEELQKSSAKSFVTNITAANKALQDKFNLVKHVIDVRLEERAEAAARAEKQSKRRLIDEAIAQKENEQLLSGSLEELKKRRAELDD